MPMGLVIGMGSVGTFEHGQVQLISFQHEMNQVIKHPTVNCFEQMQTTYIFYLPQYTKLYFDKILFNDNLQEISSAQKTTPFAAQTAIQYDPTFNAECRTFYQAFLRWEISGHLSPLVLSK